MGRRKRRRRPLYKCMVKTAMAYLRQKPGATRSQIEHKVMSIYKKQGVDHSTHQKSVRQALTTLVQSRCVQKHGPRYQIVNACARDTLSKHKRRRRLSQNRACSQSRSPTCSPISSLYCSPPCNSTTSPHCSRSRSLSGSRRRRHRRHRRRRRRSCPQRLKRRCCRSRHRKRRRQHRQTSQNSMEHHHHIEDGPPADSPSTSFKNPFSNFPFRDAIIVAMSVLFSYWLQRTASQMHFSNT